MNIEHGKEQRVDAKKTNKRTMQCCLRRMDLAIGNWRLEGERAAAGGDKELARQYAADVADLTAFRDVIADGDLDEARRLADAMDTLVRDQIPVQVYHTIFPER
jgi:hypothetical protein